MASKKQPISGIFGGSLAPDVLSEHLQVLSYILCLLILCFYGCEQMQYMFVSICVSCSFHWLFSLCLFICLFVLSSSIWFIFNLIYFISILFYMTFSPCKKREKGCGMDDREVRRRISEELRRRKPQSEHIKNTYNQRKVHKDMLKIIKYSLIFYVLL